MWLWGAIKVMPSLGVTVAPSQAGCRRRQALGSLPSRALLRRCLRHPGSATSSARTKIEEGRDQLRLSAAAFPRRSRGCRWLTGLPLARVPAGGRPCSACSCLAAFPSSPPCAALLAVCAGRGRQLGPVGLRAPRGSARCSNLCHSATWGHPAVGWGQVGEPPVGAGCAPGTRHRPWCLPTSADVLVTRVCKPAAGYRSLPVQHPGVGAGGPDRVRGRTTLCPASLQGHKGPGVTTAPGARA